MPDIDLLFTVADSSKSDILSTFADLQSDINSKYTEINYHVGDRAKSELDSLSRSMRDVTNNAKELDRTTKSSGQSVGSGVNTAVSRMKSLKAEMGTIEKSLAKINPNVDTASWSRLQSQIKTLKSEYVGFLREANGSLSSDQVDDLVLQWERVDRAVERVQSRVSDVSAQKQQTQAAKEYAETVQKLLKTNKEMGDIHNNIAKLNPDNALDAQKITQLREQVSALRKEFDQLWVQFEQNPLRTQNDWDKITALRDSLNQRTNNTADIARASLAIKQQTADYKELVSVYKEASKLEVGIHKAELDGDADKAETLTKQYEIIIQRREELMSKLDGKLSDTQMDELRSYAEDASHKISELSHAYEEARQKMSQGLADKISLGTFDAQIESLEGRISKLGGVSDGVKSKMSELQSLLNTLKSADASDSDKFAAWERFNQLLPAIAERVRFAESAMQSLHGEMNKDIGADDLLAKVQTAMQGTSLVATMFRGKLAEIAQGLREVKNESNMDATKAKVQQLAAEFANVKKQMDGMSGLFSKIGSSLSSNIKQLLGVTSAAMAIRKAWQAAKKMYDEVKKIDTSMISLYKVTDETSERYDQFLKSASRSAKELGSTIDGIIEQTAQWAKLGYTIDEAESLAKISSIYAHVGEVDNETAVSDLVTSMKAFNVEAEDAITIVDKLNILGNNFAVSSADLGAGLSRSASSLAMAGTSIEETLAMLAGGAEITQSPQEFGNFVKIAVMRIRGMKGKLEELGEEVDDSVDSISKVQTHILNLTKGAIDIFDENGAFRNYYDIMKEISAIWDDLESTAQADLAETLFGKIRSNQGFALIQAFQSGQVDKALQTALNSAGSAMKEYNRWLGGLEAKTQQFKAAWQDMAQTILDSDFAKDIVDKGSDLLNFLTKLIDKVGVLPTLLGAGGLLAGVLNFGKHNCPAWA